MVLATLAGGRLGAQTPATDTPPATTNSAVAASTSTPAPAEKKEKHGISISIGDDSINVDDEKSKLTPEQLYEIQLARAKNPRSGDLEDILVPTGFFVMIFGIVAVVVTGRLRRNRMMHETMRVFAEKGQPVPRELFDQSLARPKIRSDLRRGIFWIALGLGALAFLRGEQQHGWSLGFIPLFIGIGYLVAWKLEKPAKPELGA